MPTSPPSRCGDMGCVALATKRGRCDEHQPPAWSNRARKQARYGMSSGTMRALKKRVTVRDNDSCYVCGRERDEGETYDLEHKRPISQGGAARDLENLGLICQECHLIKSRAEAAQANRIKVNRRREARG
jgi:5-methylcytosine-specific restriction protein A